MRTVYLAAADGEITVKINSEFVGAAATAEALAEVFKLNNVNENDCITCASSIDFAGEEGFSSNSAAEEIIEDALALVDILG